MKNTQNQRNMEKVELIAEDLNMNLQNLRECALKISVNTKYQPYVFLKHPYDEIIFLQDFMQYRNIFLLADELFLYYGREKLYRTNGKAEILEAYLQLYSETEQEQIREGFGVSGYEVDFCLIDNKIFVFYPMRVSEGTYMSDAVLCAMIYMEDLQERFAIVSGGVEGNLSVYWSGELIYCNESIPCGPEQKNVFSEDLSNFGLKICYLPDKIHFMGIGQMFLQILIVLTDVILLFFIANMYAKKSYGTILNISRKYRANTAFLDEIDCENVLEEINYVMDRLLERNEQISKQIHVKHEQLQRQALRMLLEDNYLFDAKTYLEKLQIKLAGPYFFVISIAFYRQESIEKDFFEKLQIELEKISSEDRQESVYVIWDHTKKLINVICSIRELERKEKIVELIYEVSDSYGITLGFGMGNVCQNLSGISASWLESMDNLHKGIDFEENCYPHVGFTYDSSELYRLVADLIKANVKQALEGFECYIRQVEKANFSLLMQQYVFSDFINVIVKAAKEQQIELSNQSISLIVSARNLETFKVAAQNIIREFAENIQKKLEQRVADQAMQIYEYINQHYTEYDLSIEKVAESMNTTVYTVRKAVLEYSGMKYKDYVVFLRIELAKSLLLQGEKRVSEIGELCGYTNLPYFITLFKEMTGVTPAKYRKGN